MPVQHFKAEVSRILDLTYDVREMDLRLVDPPEIAFKAGQFISFDILHPGFKKPVTRPYSIASPPSQRHILTLLFNLIPGGPGSTYLFSLRESDGTQFSGPAGLFSLRKDPSRDVLFVATGTGIAPIRSMLLDLLGRGESRRISLFWGLRSQRDLYYQDELEALSRTHPNFTPMTTLSRPEVGWTGQTGRVTHLVEERISTVKNLAVYLCGNSGMIKDVTTIIHKKGLCPIYREKYYDDAGDQADY